MTDVTQRPRPTAPPQRVPTAATTPVRPLAVSAALAAVAVAAGGLVLAVGLAVIGWLGAHDGGVGGAVRVGVTCWLAGHGAPPRVGEVPLGLVPLGVPLLVVVAARRAGRWALESSAPAGDGPAAGAVAAAGLAYGLVAAGLAVVAVPAGATVDPLRAGMLAGVLAAAGIAAGLAPGMGWLARAGSVLPERASLALRGAVVGLLTLLSAAAVTVLATLAVHGSDVLALAARLAPGTVGGVLLVVIGLLLLPNAVLWCTAYLLGPGFAVGTGTAVSTSGVLLGPLPAYPPFAALPAPGEQPGWASLLLVLPPAAGVVAGIVAERRAPAGRWVVTAATGAGAGALAGAVVAGMLLVAGGAVGPGRLAETGPLPLAGMLAVGSLALGGLLGGLGVRVVGARDTLRERLPGLPRMPSLPSRLRQPWRRR